MRGWRSKLIFLTIVYFAGFATAIYCLAPVPENQTAEIHERKFAYSALKSDEFAQSFNVNLHKCVDVAKDVTERATEFVKQKLEERKTNS